MTASRWRVLGASMPGAQHDESGLPCQDAVDWRVLPEDILIAAVADGAGCTRWGGLGAQVATRDAVEFISRQDPELLRQSSCSRKLLRDALTVAREALAAEAESRQLPFEELSTTLLLALMTPEHFAAAQVGDGAVVVGNRRMGLTVITTPHIGEFCNETLFLTAPKAVAKASITVMHRCFAYLTMFTDGMQRLSLKYPEGTPHPPFFHTLFQFISQIDDMEPARANLCHFLTSEQVRERTDDDVTLCIAKLEL